MTFSLRSLLPFLLLLPTTIIAQPKAQSCIFSEDFEGEGIPAGWDIGPWVERTDSDGEPLGEQVPAWTIGNAAQASAGGYFNVPDHPIGNHFIMANDDAPPCPCDLAEVILTTPEFDFSDLSNVALEFNVYHDMLFGGGEAIVEASPNGTDWYWVYSIPAIEGDWQHHLVDMSGWEDPQVWIRFRWSDNGEWATGIAIDDVCLRERYTNDLSIENVSTGNDTISAFTTGDQSLRYTMLPLAQAGEFSISADVINRGTGIMTDVTIEAMIQLDGTDHGPFNSDPISSLQPGERTKIVIGTGWVPPTTGEASLTATVNASDTDEDPTDNTNSTQVQITGPGWVDGYSAMAVDDREIQGSMGGSEIFVAGNRFELVNAGTPTGISAVIGGGTEVGTEVRAILFDANFAVIDTSVRRAITQEDIDMGYGGAGIYLPFSAPGEHPPGDLFAGIQKTSVTGIVMVNVSGNSPLGASFQMQGTTFTLSYPQGTPMVRLHFEDVGVGVAEQLRSTNDLGIYPMPLHTDGVLSFFLNNASQVNYSINDLAGRTMHLSDLGRLGAGRHLHPLSVSDLPSGNYTLTLVLDDHTMTRSFMVIRP